MSNNNMTVDVEFVHYLLFCTTFNQRNGNLLKCKSNLPFACKYFAHLIFLRENDLNKIIGWEFD